jgi:hypothetical protein
VICLVDSDIIYKLPMCNLLDDTLTALDSARTDVYVLPTAKYKFSVARRRPDTGEQRYGAEVFARIRDFLASVREIDVAGPSEELQLLASIDGIDAGEAILFSATAEFDQYLLAIGDKTSLRALALAPVCLPIAQRIRGHVICLEQIVKRLIQHFGFLYAKNKIVPARACDTALSAAFGSGWDATERNVLAALDSYINELRSLPIDLLTDVDWPPGDSRQLLTAVPGYSMLALTRAAST